MADATVSENLCPAQTQVGQAASHSPQSAHAAGGLPDDCASFQSAAAIPQTDAVSKTYVLDMRRRHQYLILTARRKLKCRVPRPMPCNRV